MPIITALSAREILDSRGVPTVEASCELEGGVRATASVPSGRSTGEAEALELRDGDKTRYRGKGCRTAANNVNTKVRKALVGNDYPDQAALDRALLDLDGTDNKRNLGANAVLAVSVAFGRALAEHRDQPLYHYFASLIDSQITTLPRLTINLFSGGEHAGKQVAVQDALIVPSSPTTIDASLVMMHDIYMPAADLALVRHGMRLLTADEGGLAPPFPSSEAMLEGAVEAIDRAGYTPGRDAHIALDIASSHFYKEGVYHLEDERLDAPGMIDRLGQWAERYPIVSIEDGLAENDWEHWPALCERLSGRAITLGDDLLCTNPTRIRRAIDEKSCDALLLKVNQIGTLTEAAEALRLARDAGWKVTISVRSGETEDHWAADLAVGWSGDQFKNGSVTQSERLAKYNRLLQIETELDARIVDWPNR